MAKKVVIIGPESAVKAVAKKVAENVVNSKKYSGLRHCLKYKSCDDSLGSCLRGCGYACFK